MCYSAIAIANYFIQKGKDEKRLLTNIQLQKMLYFSYAVYYRKTQSSLFTDPIFAWPYGPVVLSVYQALDCYGNNDTIPHRIRLYNPIEELYVPMVNPQSEAIVSHLQNTWDSLKGLEPWKLVELSHAKDGAWYKTVKDNGYDPEADDLIAKLPRNLIIKDKDIYGCGR